MTGVDPDEEEAEDEEEGTEFLPVWTIRAFSSCKAEKEDFKWDKSPNVSLQNTRILCLYVTPVTVNV